MSKKPAPERITLTFDLHDLPTAQHRAGLAGLILQIDSMGEDGNRRPEKLIPEIEELTATSATITFTRDSMQGVFDDLYAAKLDRGRRRQQVAGRGQTQAGRVLHPEEGPEDGRDEAGPGFAYDVVQPLGPVPVAAPQGWVKEPLARPLAADGLVDPPGGEQRPLPRPVQRPGGRQALRRRGDGLGPGRRFPGEAARSPSSRPSRSPAP